MTTTDEPTDEQIRAVVTYRLGEKFINLVNVSAMLGHAQVENSLCYVHPSDPENTDGPDPYISLDVMEIIRAVLEGQAPLDILQRFPWIDHGWSVPLDANGDQK